MADQHQEFKGVFSIRVRQEGTIIYRISLEAPWQNAKTERRGGVFVGTLNKTLARVVPTSWEDYEECVIQAQNAGNALGSSGLWYSVLTMRRVAMLVDVGIDLLFTDF